MEIGVIGSSEFTLGFQLTGIKKVAHFREEKDLLEFMKDPELGVIITNQETFDSLKENTKEDVVNSIKPVVVVVSNAPQEELRKMIIQAIGVDLLNKD